MKRLLLCLIVIILSACTYGQEKKHEGVIVYKQPENKGTQLLVVSNTNKKDIQNKTKEELINIAQYKDGAYYYVTNDEYENLEVGTHVNVYWDGSQAESNPPQRGADKIEIVLKE